MRETGITLIIIVTLILGACNTTRKGTTTTKPGNDVPSAKAADGIYAPGSEELIAIRAQYNNVTLEQLKEGYTLYAQGACIDCHRAKNIYLIEDAHCKEIIEDMAQRARISDEQKEAVYKYVLAIKAAQPKNVK